MTTNTLHGRSFLKELDFTPLEWRELLTLSASLKADKKAGREVRHLTGKNIALIFEKTSTRTRCAFEVAAFDQGAHVTYLDSSGSQIGHKESMKDTARVLGRMYDGIQYRGSRHELVETLGEFAGVPVWNGLTDDWHPTQSLCDILTMREACPKPDEEIAFAYCGDARNNVGNSLLLGGALMGMDVRMVAPRELWNSDEVIASARAIAQTTGARITQTEDVGEGVAGTDFIYTDVWVSMGQEKEQAQRTRAFKKYQVNAKLMGHAAPHAVFMHCLPAHRGHEVTDDVIDGPRSIVFDQAENRLHTQKAILTLLMGK